MPKTNGLVSNSELTPSYPELGLAFKVLSEIELLLLWLLSQVAQTILHLLM